jgi:hypothetical protein
MARPRERRRPGGARLRSEIDRLLAAAAQAAIHAPPALAHGLRLAIDEMLAIVRRADPRIAGELADRIEQTTRRVRQRNRFRSGGRRPTKTWR